VGKADLSATEGAEFLVLAFDVRRSFPDFLVFCFTQAIVPSRRNATSPSDIIIAFFFSSNKRSIFA
jgi:hypothetical protein